MSTDLVPPSDGQELVEAAQRRRRRRPPRSLTRATATDPDLPRAPKRKAEDRATRGTDPVGVPQPSPRANAAWLITAGIAAVGLVVFAGFTHSYAPLRPSISRTAWSFSSGPRAAKTEADSWLARFQWRDQLSRPDAWVLERLSQHLSEQPVIAAVDRIAWAVATGPKGPVSELRFEVRLRQPELPVQLANGRQAWLDHEGRVLPAALPPPQGRRPLVRGIEAGTDLRLAAAEAWSLLSTRVDPTLITGIDCDGTLDERTKGLVLVTKHGTRILWGRPDDSRFGMDAERKADGLVHVLNCQGDPSRLTEINLRFKRETFRVRN